MRCDFSQLTVFAIFYLASLNVARLHTAFGFSGSAKGAVNFGEFDIKGDTTLVPNSWTPLGPEMEMFEENGETTSYRVMLPLMPNNIKTSAISRSVDRRKSHYFTHFLN